MAYFPDKTTVKTELREATSEVDLSCVHLTTANFFELNIAYYRENTPREKWQCTTGVFARPAPMQAPVMGEATLKLKNYYVPYRVISPQWNDFITRTPHMTATSTIPFIVQEMPYFTAKVLIQFIKEVGYSTTGSSNQYDFIDQDGNYILLTQEGRHCVKILNQLGYQMVMNNTVTEHFDAMPLLAFAKIFVDYYTSNQYSGIYEAGYEVEALFKKDNETAYALTAQDLLNIFELTKSVMYSPDYFTSQWDNPTAPNNVITSFGSIEIKDITTLEEPNTQGTVAASDTYAGGTPYLQLATGRIITQYALDALKGLTDYVKRMQISSRAIDRYLARFGVMLTAEKMQRSIYNGEQNTTMNFGAIYSTAETEQAAIGDYAGQGQINSAGQNHNIFEFDNLDEFGCIMTLMNINPKIGYYQGIDRQHLIRNVESYFNGQWDNLGTQATSCAELYISPDGRSIYGKQQQFDAIFGYLPRQAQYKIGKDRLTGDFVRKSINKGAEAWHMFRVIDETNYSQVNNTMMHNPQFVNSSYDREQYNRIFNNTEDDNGDKINIILTHNCKANIHAKPLYDSFDFEGEGKKMIMDGQGAKQN